MFLIDSNIFLEMLLDQKRADECQSLIEKIINGEIIGYVSSFTIHSIEVILERKNKIDMLKFFLEDISKAKGIKRFDTTTIEELFAIDLMEKNNLDFDDALHYYISKTLNLKIISFDKHFDKTEIKRVEPIEIL